jgi:SAM-dependent methyltransferase
MSQTGLICRSCGEPRLLPILDLGSTPLANALLTNKDLKTLEAHYPLALVFCPTCTLVQLTETVPPEKLFSEYLYFSSYSDTMLRHAEQLAGRMAQERNLDKGSLVVEIASNDGYLLKNYLAHGIPVLGIEPAHNIAQVARQTHGIETLEEFFGLELAERLARDGKRADLMHAHNVLAHVPDLNGVAAGIRTLLKPDGVAVIEAPYIKDLIDHGEFDTIYHEHLFYFSLTALVALFERQGLRVVNVERIALHGGSLRVFVSHAEGTLAAPAVVALLMEESAWGVADVAFYKRFAARVESLKRDLVALLTRLKSEGNRLAAYGASAKGSTLLNYFGLGSDLLDFVVDRSPIKQGRYTPGAHLPIFAPEKLLEERPNYVLLLTWNFKEEILAQQAAYTQQGGRFIVPIPEPAIL